MAEPAEPLPESAESDAVIPEGWQLGSESWKFHRTFFHRVGRPAQHREYSKILWAIRRGTDVEKLAPFRFRVRLADGTPIVVCGGRQRLSGVEPADWTPPPPRPPRVWIITPKPPKQAPAVAAPAAPEPVAAAPVAPPPVAPARRPPGPSTLTLGNPKAAKALADRLQRLGVPVPTNDGASAP